MVTTKKQQFLFPSQTMPSAPTEARVAATLEFIAHYLDRIDSHLERLASAAESGDERLHARVEALTDLLGRK
jgi:hypothetical protein